MSIPKSTVSQLLGIDVKWHHLSSDGDAGGRVPGVDQESEV